MRSVARRYLQIHTPRTSFEVAATDPIILKYYLLSLWIKTKIEPYDAVTHCKYSWWDKTKGLQPSGSFNLGKADIAAPLQTVSRRMITSYPRAPLKKHLNQ